MRTWKYTLLLVCIPALLSAQTSRDSVQHAASDSSHAQRTKKDSVFVMTKSPLEATLLSAVIPGAGQFYNEDYLKIPVIWIAGGFFLYEFIHNNNQFIYYQNIYFNSTDTTIRGTPQYFNLKESYRDARDLDGAYMFLIYALNILDAYVSSHLFDFNVSDVKLKNQLGDGFDKDLHNAFDDRLIKDAHIVPYITPYNGIGASLYLNFR